MKHFFFFFLCFVCLSLAVSAQDTLQVIDTEYREDQFYFGISYNIATNNPVGFQQRGFSGGVGAGFIRDFPINKRRNVALGIGIGWGLDSYNNNLFIGEDAGGDVVFQVLDSENINYDSNRYGVQSIEIPLEFRWRTSTPSIYKFWRIYGGVKFEYNYFFKSKFEQSGNSLQQKDFEGLNRITYGATLSLGRGNFNLHVYYSLRPLFSGQTTNNQEVKFSTVQLGLMFYIL